MKNFLLLLPFLLLLSGCLPPGDPPPGNIVTNPTRNGPIYASTPGEAVEKVISGLTAALLSECPGEPVAIDVSPGLSAAARLALHECGKLSGNTLASSGEQTSCRLLLKQQGRSWQWQFFRDSRLLWEETVIFR